MAGTGRRQPGARDFRDPPDFPQRTHPYILPRAINVPWASIGNDDLLPGELVANVADNSLVWRKDSIYIYRFANDATRTI